MTPSTAAHETSASAEADAVVAQLFLTPGGRTELAAALGARDLPPRIEEARAELARVRGDTAAAERALRAAAELHRANGDVWLAARAEARIGSGSSSPLP